MKILQHNFVLKLAFLVTFGLLATCTTNSQPRLTAAQAAALQPTPPNFVPMSGNFWSLQRPDFPPYPSDPYPNLSAYLLPDGSYLVDDASIAYPPIGKAVDVIGAARSFVAENRLAAQQTLLQHMFNDVSDSGIPPFSHQLDPAKPHPASASGSGNRAYKRHLLSHGRNQLAIPSV
jgi:hypothetical protein